MSSLHCLQEIIGKHGNSAKRITGPRFAVYLLSFKSWRVESEAGGGGGRGGGGGGGEGEEF